MSDQTPRAIPVADDAAPESLAEASFETATATHKRSDHREPHAGPGLWARAREAFFALPRGLHIVILIIFYDPRFRPGNTGTCPAFRPP